MGVNLDSTERDAIARNFDANVDRVRSLVGAFDQLAPGGAGSPSMVRVDVLRAAIVLLHASLEDVVRSASERLLPHSERRVLDDIGFPDGPEKTKQKFSLGDLHAFKGQTVDDVIQAAVSTSLQRSNYNSVAEIAGALERIGIKPQDVLEPHQATLEAFIKRRHLIVHRADKKPTVQRGRGVRLTQHLSKTTAENWLSVVSDVGRRIIAALSAAQSEQGSQ